MGTDITQSGMSRVWITENGAGPFNEAEYHGCVKIGDSTWNFGDVEKIECPDPNRYGAFVEVGSVPGQIERPSTSIMGRYPMSLSELLRLARKGCRLDVQVRIGMCHNPQDAVEGWEKIRVYPKARISSWADENAGALNSDESDATNETVEVSASEIYEVTRMTFEELASATVAREIITIEVCDSISCGECGDASGGCDKVLAIMIGTGATPGTLPSVVYSSDGGTTWYTTDIDTLFSNETPSDAACISGNLFVVVNVSNSIHYASVEEIMDGTEIWVEVNTGFVAGGSPNAIWSVDARHTWIVGAGGYVYFSSDPTQGVVVQTAGAATLQDLVDVHAYDTEHVVAVGNINTVIFTENGGATWQTATGPAIGIGLTSVWMMGPRVWLVGDANGVLYKTRNAGATWVVCNMPVPLVRIDEIEFANDTIGYIAARDGAAHGLILRTINGGYSWYVMPEGPGSAPIPDNDQINAIAACKDNVNLIFAGGLGGDGVDGIIIKAA